MAQSHIKLTGGLRDGKSLRNTITLNGHGFSAGQAIRFNREAATGISGDFYTPALANNAMNAEVIGVIESTTENTFELVYGGEISLASFHSEYTITDNDVFFLSGVTSGLLTETPPTNAGRVIKPVVVRTDGNTGVVTNYVGTVIGGSSVVNLDGIQPVGAIEPYAGSATDIPDGWSLCDGGSLSITDFASLYNRVGRNYGYNIKFSPSTASTITTAIQVGMKIQQGQLTGRITEVNAASNYIMVDVDYLELTTNGFDVHSFVFSNTLQTTIPNTTGLSQSFFGSLTGDGDVQPDSEISLGIGIVEITHFRKPDLRGKTAIGTADLSSGTVLATDREFKLGQIGGEYEHQLTIAEMPSHDHDYIARLREAASGPISLDDRIPEDSTKTSKTGGDQAHNNVQPYVSINWIIKTTALASAAVVDSLSIAIPLTGLTDVDILPTNGDVPMYDPSTTPDKFRSYRLLTNYKSDASQIFQIDTSGTLPKVKVGSPASDNGFSVNLDGVGSGTSKFEVLNSSGTPLFEVQKDSSTSTGVGSIGTGIDTNANLTIGAKGLKFLSSSPIITSVKDTVAAAGFATDTNLVTEKAVREAVAAGTETYFLTQNRNSVGTSTQTSTPSWSTSTSEVVTYQLSWSASTTVGTGTVTIINDTNKSIEVAGFVTFHLIPFINDDDGSVSGGTLHAQINNQTIAAGDTLTITVTQNGSTGLGFGTVITPQAVSNLVTYKAIN